MLESAGVSGPCKQEPLQRHPDSGQAGMTGKKAQEGRGAGGMRRRGKATIEP